MSQSIIVHLEELVSRYPVLSYTREEVLKAYDVLLSTYSSNHKLLVAGNGGSAADAEHIAGELMKRFKIPRPIHPSLQKRLIAADPKRGKSLATNLENSLMTIPLVAHEALSTAYINDVDGYGVFAQQLLGFGRQGDAFLAISTSGYSENILNAAVVAKALGISVIGLTGKNGGELKKMADVCVCVPEEETYKVQELHLPIYHVWCMMLEEHFFGSASDEDD